MRDLTWELFRQTGNIETYLLLKELEEQQTMDETNVEMDNQRISPLDLKR